MLVHKFSPNGAIKQMGCDDADHNSMRRGRAAAPRLAAQSQQPGCREARFLARFGRELTLGQRGHACPWA
jgi:hypothetical protein